MPRIDMNFNKNRSENHSMQRPSGTELSEEDYQQMHHRMAMINSAYNEEEEQEEDSS